MAVGARPAGLTISHAADLLGFPGRGISRFYCEKLQRRHSPVGGRCVQENSSSMSGVRGRGQ